MFYARCGKRTFHTRCVLGWLLTTARPYSHIPQSIHRGPRIKLNVTSSDRRDTQIKYGVPPHTFIYPWRSVSAFFQLFECLIKYSLRSYISTLFVFECSNLNINCNATLHFQPQTWKYLKQRS